MSLLDEIITHFTIEFSSDWISQFSFSSEEDRENSKSTIWQKFFRSSTFIYKRIDFSILSGEYVFDESILKKVDEIIELVKDIVIFTIPETIGQENEILENQAYIFNQIKDYYIDPLLWALKRYKFFIHFAQRKFQSQDTNSILFELHDEEQLQNNNSNHIDSNVFKKIKLVAHNIELSRIDLSLTVDESTLSRCLIIAQEVKTIRQQLPEKHYNSILSKANFLAYKILYRYDQAEQKYLYGLNFAVGEVNKETLNVGIFSSFKEITDSHYGEQPLRKKDYPKRVKDFYQKIENKETPLFKDYHAVVKYYKDNTKSLEQLGDLVDRYEIFCIEYLKKGGISSFDKRAISVSRQYFLNNNLSLEIAKKEINISNWKDACKIVIKSNEGKGINNYFPYYKLSILLLDEIENLFEKEDSDVKRLEILIKDFEELINNLFISLDWCEKNKFLAYQLPFEECLLHDIDLDLNIFLSSSFVLPIDYSKLIGEKEKIKFDLIKYKSMLGIQKNIDKQKGQIDEVKRQSEKNEKRSIEILSIFSAIVLFASGNIQIFTKISNINRALEFMLLFGFVLCLFVFLIWSITRPDGLKKIAWSSIHKILIGVLFVGTVTTLAMLTEIPPFDKTNKNEEFEKVNKRIDSTELKLDSLIKK